MNDRAPRVLIVDDELVVASGLGALLKLEGFEVSTLPSPLTIPLEIRRLDPDVVLMDLNMPALSGETFMKAGGRRFIKGAPLILFSGRSRPELAAIANRLGADGYLSKGDDLADIVTYLNAVVRQRRRFDHQEATPCHI